MGRTYEGATKVIAMKEAGNYKADKVVEQ